MRRKFDKYAFYESAVQSPEDHVVIFDRMFRELRGHQALSLREDFCGTFLISCRWIQSHPKRTAVGVDLDPEPLNYGKGRHQKRLTAGEKKRLRLLQQNVMKPSARKFDVIGAGNFSFFVFKERHKLLNYFRAARQSLNADGIFTLELAGGPGFIQKGREQRTYRVPGLGKYTYYWEQKDFDPVTHFGKYAIHFRIGKQMHKNVFTYDWRVWTIPELKEALLEAGFKEAHVYWENADSDGEGTGEFVRATEGENDLAWIAFVVGLK